PYEQAARDGWRHRQEAHGIGRAEPGREVHDEAAHPAGSKTHATLGSEFSKACPFRSHASWPTPSSSPRLKKVRQIEMKNK
ncbi:MAG: hypothetical protein ACK55I_32675, partial [bacterium]